MGRFLVTAIAVTAIAISSVSSAQGARSTPAWDLLTQKEIAERMDLFIETFRDLNNDFMEFSKSAIARRDPDESSAMLDLSAATDEGDMIAMWAWDIANLTLAADKNRHSRDTVLLRFPFLRGRLDLLVKHINSTVPYITNQGAISRADALRKEIRELKKFISEVEGSLTR